MPLRERMPDYFFDLAHETRVWISRFRFAGFWMRTIPLKWQHRIHDPVLNIRRATIQKTTRGRQERLDTNLDFAPALAIVTLGHGEFRSLVAQVNHPCGGTRTKKGQTKHIVNEQFVELAGSRIDSCTPLTSVSSPLHVSASWMIFGIRIHKGHHHLACRCSPCGWPC